MYYVKSSQQFCLIKNNHTIACILEYSTRLRRPNSTLHYKVSLRATLTFPSVSDTKPVRILAVLVQLEQKIKLCETS